MTWLPFSSGRPTHWFAGPVSLCGTLARPPGEPTARFGRKCRLCHALLDRGAPPVWVAPPHVRLMPRGTFPADGFWIREKR